MDVSLSYATQLKGLLAKSDGKDKFVALLQYAAMFASAGEPGRFLSAQKSLSAARKPFRVFKPIEFLMPLVERPPKGKGVGACVQYVKALGMAVYMGADHLVWATSCGVISDTAKKDRQNFYQKLSLWSWFAASCATIVQQTGDLTKALDDMSACGEDETKKKECASKARAVMSSVTTSAAQAFLALALLDKTPFVTLSKRQIGALGVALSVANCVSLAPARKSKTA